MIAITREVSPSIARAELTHLARTPIDYPRAVKQHADYCAALRALNVEVRTLPADAAYPDCVFVEDTAIVLDELAIITRPGAASRRGETAAIAEALAPLRPIVTIEEPATIDGGDVLRLGRTLYIGRSERTNDDAFDKVMRFVHPHGYEVVAVELHGALHLKTAVTRLSQNTLLINPEWVDGSVFGRSSRILPCHPSEPFAANALMIGQTAIVSAQYPRTLDRLQRVTNVIAVDTTELAKAEGGVSCCSILL